MLQHSSESKSRRLERLLRPKSVAIVGASDKPGSFGASVMTNLAVAGYAGEIYPVNPKRAEIGGRPCVSDPGGLPFGVDCAVIAVPKAGVLDAVRSCAGRGVGGVIIYTAGFSETGEEGKAEQEQLARIARESGMVIEGPNCLGLVNNIDGAPLTFVTVPRPEFPVEKGVGIVSQSGAMAAVLGVALRHHAIDITYSISTGNEADTGVEDYVEFLLDEPHTSVVVLLVEQFRQPRRFLRLAGRAHSRGKRIVLLHPGSSGAARASAATHTGAIAGDYGVMRAKVGRAGVVLVETVEELLDVSHLLLRCASVPSAGAAVLTESGAFKALTLDLCERAGLPLPPLSAAAAAALREALPDFIVPSNPLDVTAQGLVDPDLYRRVLPPLLADPAFGSVVLTIILTDEATGRLKLPPILDAVASIGTSKPVLFAGLDEGAWIDPQYVNRLRELKVPFLPTAERAFRALSRLTSAARPAAELTCGSVAAEKRIAAGTLTEWQSKQLLALAGLPVPKGELARDVEQAQAVADRLGYPVVLKAQSPLLPHKTEAGGVVLNLRDRAEVVAGWGKLQSSVQAARPGLRLDGVLVESMGARGTELIVGARNDPNWGPVLLVGMGGIFAEALADVRLMVPGVTADEVLAELLRLKGAALLEGHRGTPAPDLDAVAELVLRLAEFVVRHPEIEEVDLNPVMATPEGVVLLDALIVSGQHSAVGGAE